MEIFLHKIPFSRKLELEHSSAAGVRERAIVGSRTCNPQLQIFYTRSTTFPAISPLMKRTYC